MITWIVIGVIVVFILFVVVGGYNKLVALDQRADQSFADIDVQLKQRQDLIPNLVETVKGYATHERATLDAVTQARAVAAGATSVNDKVEAENMLTATLGRLFAVSEAYPDLKANTNFQQLQTELSDIENKPPAASSTMRCPSSTQCAASSRPCCSPPWWALARTSPSSTSARVSARP